MEKLMSQYGSCKVSRYIVEKKRNVKWCMRQEKENDSDSGWVFWSDVDEIFDFPPKFPRKISVYRENSDCCRIVEKKVM